MGVLLDTSAAVAAAVPTTTCNVNITVGNNPNRALLVKIYTRADRVVSSVTTSGGGPSGSAIAGATQTTSNSDRLQMWGVTAPNTGAITVTVTLSVSEADGFRVIVESYYNVNQSTPFLNGSASTPDFHTVHSHSVTSVAGDLTSTAVSAAGTAAGNFSTNRTEISDTVGLIASDHGDGSGTLLHTWTINAANWIMIVGVSIKASEADATLMGQACL